MLRLLYLVIPMIHAKVCIMVAWILLWRAFLHLLAVLRVRSGDLRQVLILQSEFPLR